MVLRVFRRQTLLLPQLTKILPILGWDSVPGRSLEKRRVAGDAAKAGFLGETSAAHPAGQDAS
jgi:hypothetical protein